MGANMWPGSLWPTEIYIIQLKCNDIGDFLNTRGNSAHAEIPRGIAFRYPFSSFLYSTRFVLSEGAKRWHFSLVLFPFK